MENLDRHDGVMRQEYLKLRRFLCKEYDRLKNIYWIMFKQNLKNAQSQLLASTDISDDEKNILKNVSLKIHTYDTMHGNDAGRHYLTVGFSAIRCIQKAISSTGRQFEPESILDFACGSGRVLRFLREKFPNSDFTGSETDISALKFCSKNFSVTPVVSKIPFKNIELNRRFDLIWCGSLITHIDEQSTIDLLNFFFNHLSEKGLCVFTTHGTLTMEWFEKGMKTPYGLSKDKEQKIVDEYYSRGYGYSDYFNARGYGISAVTRKHLNEIARNAGDWHETMFLEHGWDNHQDVYAFSKTTPKK
jgi:SAM-dependent methyltransferase